MSDHEAGRGERLQFSPAPLLLLFAFGAIVLTIFDGFHTYSGTTRYASIVALQCAWWAPLNFGLAGAVGGSIYALTYQTLRGRKAPPSWPRLALGLVIFGSLYAWSGFYHGPSETKLVVLSVAAVALFVWLDRTLAGAICALVTVLTGPMIEILISSLGWFEYRLSDFHGIPMWLPALYACSAPVIGQGARRCLLAPVAAPAAAPEK